jgi:hypothetical protein
MFEILMEVFGLSPSQLYIGMIVSSMLLVFLYELVRHGVFIQVKFSKRILMEAKVLYFNHRGDYQKIGGMFGHLN